MANIKITVEGSLMDGHKITFKAPCNCDAVEKLDVRYIENNTQKSKLFTMKDSHGNDLTGLGNLFFKDAYVDVVLDPNSGSAYLQNAGTNAYLEEKLKTAGTPVDNLLSDRADLPLSARQGKILNESLDELSKKSEWTFLGNQNTEEIIMPVCNEVLIIVHDDANTKLIRGTNIWVGFIFNQNRNVRLEQPCSNTDRVIFEYSYETRKIYLDTTSSASNYKKFDLYYR